MAREQLEDGHDTALAQWRRQVEQARYHAAKAERRYRAVGDSFVVVGDCL
jgi:hypothetical protein